MRQISFSNLKKTVYFLRRNGIKNTCYEIKERLEARKQPPYVWEPPALEKLAAERRWAERTGAAVKFSILVPAYRTPENYLRELADSLIAQTYPRWELILADATEEDSVSRVIEGYGDARFHYVRLERNGGISENTNRALELATGEYVGLLDHDDILTPDALYEMAVRIEEGRLAGREPRMLYSDEDKCDGGMQMFYEPNRKEDFNFDLLLCNNYICHFLVMERDLIQRLGFRKEFDGAQDFDLALRAAEELAGGFPAGESGVILHVPRVLYHWRCHKSSTSENPRSKDYAYDAGRRAVQSLADRRGWEAQAQDMPHPGFYRLAYSQSPLRFREDLGAVGGRLVSRGRITGGRMKADGTVIYEGLPAAYSGYMHRAVLQQDAEALDVRSMEVRASLRSLFEKITGVPYIALPGTERFDPASLPGDADPVEISLRFSRFLREQGYRLLYLPDWPV